MTLLVVLIIVVLIVVVAAAAQHNRDRQEQECRAQAAERQRVEECGEVVLFFANHLGYIARDAISRAELAQLIDAGRTGRELAEVISERIDEIPGLTLGYHALGNCAVEVKLTDERRARHVYIIGKSGSGKTNLLRTMIFQDLEEGEGLGVIAPEQEMLTEEILPYIPDHRIDDVIYVNPADTECPVSFNPLELDEGEDLDIKVDEVLTIFKRVVGETGPRMEEILRQALYALTGRPGATLLDIERLLDRGQPEFRNDVISDCQDEALARFWSEVYPTLPKDAHLPITNRLGRFLRPKTVRTLLCQPQSSLNFRRAMDEGRILLFNLSDGVLGEQNSQILGQLVISKFQLAVMSRASQAKHARAPFYLYIDEFQTFTGVSATSYEKMLSRARKYNLRLILAHQQTGQIPTGLLREILGNVSTSICFAVSREDAAKFAKEFITEYDGEVIHIPEEDILRLRVGQAYCKIGQHCFLMHTFLADQRPDRARAKFIIERARRNYGRPALLLAPAMSSGRPMGRSEASDWAAALDDLDPAKVFED
jgi:hypothetical protein